MPLTVIEILSGAQGKENHDEKSEVFSKAELFDEATDIHLLLSEIFEAVS